MEGNGYATREQLFDASSGKRRFADVELPVSGLKVRIRSLMESELSDYQLAAVQTSTRGVQVRDERMRDANRRFIAACLVDKDGRLLLDKGEYNKLAGMDSVDSQHLYNECAKHTGVNRDDIEALVKNSETIAGAGSPTA